MLTLNKSPEALSSAHLPFIFGLSSSIVSTSSTVVKMVYQLVNPLNTPLTVQEAFTPFLANTIYEFDFRSQVKSLVDTFVPNPENGFGYRDSSIIAFVKLKYTLVVTDTITCVTTVSESQYSNVIGVVNGVFQNYEKDIFNKPVFVLSHQPKLITQSRYTRNFIWIGCGVASLQAAQVITTLYLKDGSTIERVTIVEPGQVMICPFHCKLGFSTSDQDAEYIELRVLNTDIKYKAIIHEDSCENNFRHLMYLDSYGGRSLVSAKSVLSLDITTTQETNEKFRAYRANTTDNYINSLTSSGSSITNKKVLDIVTLTVETFSSYEDSLWIKDLLSSSSYHIQSSMMENGVLIPCFKKFILNQGQYNYFTHEGTTTLTITGRLSETYQILQDLL